MDGNCRISKKKAIVVAISITLIRSFKTRSTTFHNSYLHISFEFYLNGKAQICAPTHCLCLSLKYNDIISIHSPWPRPSLSQCRPDSVLHSIVANIVVTAPLLFDATPSSPSLPPAIPVVVASWLPPRPPSSPSPPPLPSPSPTPPPPPPPRPHSPQTPSTPSLTPSTAPPFPFPNSRAKPLSSSTSPPPDPFKTAITLV